MSDSENKIIIGSDHAGFALKEHIKKLLTTWGKGFHDAGAHREDPDDDYPVFGKRVAEAVANGTYARGIAICGTGIGISIMVNRFHGVRGALCTSVHMAQTSRSHNNSNVLVLGGRTTPFDEAERITQAWLSTDFEGGRHGRRVEAFESLSS